MQDKLSKFKDEINELPVEMEKLMNALQYVVGMHPVVEGGLSHTVSMLCPRD